MNLGLERIKQLSAEVKDAALLKIVNYLLTREDMNDKFLNEEKSLSQMITYIKSQAKEKAKDGVAMIEDEVVFGWAIHYFDESNTDLKISKEKIEPAAIKKEVKLAKPSKTTWPAEGQLSLFD